ncbi:mannosyl-3-phosphoglycerate phosphatase [Ferrimonas sp. SCSIO 43195]|uniref:HAD-IIB family hydrolase n=1 Tax=Ferrimonas sp. SCSIO 43195 TaxID=2822844 RepID=UPI0020756E52|nr:HAD-IIB family hydrolase [Ferrimonas sp. SCSIO 43195]USD36967.1 HAD-IIB family hydrolase [Ferrimonas sp. SCSIO 43195]
MPSTSAITHRVAPPLVVVTDLDGTLLDHHHYHFRAALPALSRLAALAIPVILNTSKTQAEVAQLRRQLDNHCPYVVENGGALLWPEGNDVRIQRLGRPRQAILEILQRLHSPLGLSLQGFANWDVDQLCQHTGLTPQAAAQALDRHYSEPLLWPHDDATLARLRQLLAPHQLQALKGGRFLHIQGHHDKSDALAPLRQYYQRLWGCPPVIVALGDGGNDRRMLELADWAVVIRTPDRAPLHLSPRRGRTTLLPTGIGPEGWNQAIQRILNHYRSSDLGRSTWATFTKTG